MDAARQREMPAALRHAPPVPTRTPLSFGSVGDDLAERLVINATSVPLVAQPGLAGDAQIMELVRGDEVAVLERDEGWLNVLTPTGAAGWIQSIVAGSGEVVDGHAGPTPASARPVPASPQVQAPIDLAALFAAARAQGPTPVHQAAEPPSEAPPDPDSDAPSGRDRTRSPRQRPRQDPGPA
jgi:hypothetical protein